MNQKGATQLTFLLVALIIIAVAVGGVMLLLQRGEKAGDLTGDQEEERGLPENYFSIDRVYFENFIDYMGNISPYDFTVVVEITSGGRGVTEWSLGLDYGDGVGFVENVFESRFGGMPRENNKIILKEGVSKWTLGGGIMHPLPGRTYYVKITLHLTDNSIKVWDGYAGYLH